MTPRKVSLLARRLPAGARIWQEMGSDAAWPVEAHLAAMQVDVAQLANWQRGGGKGEKPKRLPRPSESARREAGKDRIAAKAEAFKRRQAARPDPNVDRHQAFDTDQ